MKYPGGKPLMLKRKNYTPFPGLYDLRIFNLNPKQFSAAWRVQAYLYRASKQKDYYQAFAPSRWEQIKELAARLQMLLLPLLKPNEELR